MLVDKFFKCIDDIESSIKLYRNNLADESTIAKNIETDLNNFFRTDSGAYVPRCDRVIFNKNIDKQFFGLNVYPILVSGTVRVKNLLEKFIINPDTHLIVDAYYLEIDSKLYSALTDREIAICILYDITALCTDDIPFNKTRNLVNEYLINKGEIIKPSEFTSYNEIFEFGIRDCMQKLTSMFNIGDKAITNNDFFNNISEASSTGFDKIIANIRTKLKTNGLISFNEYETPIVVLSWVLNLYNHMKDNKRTARKELMDIINMVSSQLRKREIENLMRRLDRIDDNMLNEGFISNALNSFKVSGLKGYENDYYELKFEANNVEDDDQALLLIARINSHMSVIADYLSTEENISTSQRVRWTKLLNDYNMLRNQLASEKLRRNKTRLYVNYGFDD